MSEHSCACFVFFFFNGPATTEIYTLSLHDALPISGPIRIRSLPRQTPGNCVPALRRRSRSLAVLKVADRAEQLAVDVRHVDRKSTRLNSSHANISYAVFCLKKKNNSLVPPKPDSRL